MFQNTGVALSVEQVIAKRRLQEQYCLQFAKCVVVSNANSELVGLQFVSLFGSCLRDEALEQYDAVSRSR
jgi:hypothetical protein